MSSLGDAASRIGEKIVDILDVFDLSFFISGSVAMAALLQFFGPLGDTLDTIDGVKVFGLVLGSYVLGLVCFAVGRPLRQHYQRWRTKPAKEAVGKNPSRLNPELYEALWRQGLIPRYSEEPPGGQAAAFQDFFCYHAPPRSRDQVACLEHEEERALSQLYTRLWVHVRSYERLSESFMLLKRYWVLSASYDGVAIAAAVWLLPVWRTAALQGWAAEHVGWSVVWTIAIGVALLACWHRALEYKRYQIEEIVATVAHWLSLVGKPDLATVASTVAAPVGLKGE